MILNWGLENFKSIKDNMGLSSLRPLTLIAGANSSGKSTFIQSILLMMQTMANRDNVALQINGELVRLGQTDDIWHYGQFRNLPLKIEMLLKDIDDDDLSLYIKVDFEPINFTEVQVITAEYAVGIGQNPKKYEYRLHIEINNGGYYITYISDSLREDILRELYLRGFDDIAPFDNTFVEIEDFYPRFFRIEAQAQSRELNWESVLANPRSFPLNDTQLNEDIPNEHWVIILKIADELRFSGLRPALLNKDKPMKLKQYREWFGKLSTEKSERLSNRLTKELIVSESKEFFLSIEFFEKIKRLLDEVFTQRIRYLSANRIPPTMLFGLDVASSWSEVGISGENVALALREHGNRMIRFWNPFVSQIQENTMINALVIWLQFFELVDRVDTEDRGKLGTLLKIYTSGIDKEFDLTSVGFGTSQILPILVQGLLTPPNSIFIVEQPEVHLHPRVQSQLADFFLSLARAGVQCIIETHSEHIVNRLRLRIVEDIGTETLDLIRIYFVEKIDSETYFRDVQANEYGAIAKWPEGFFDQVENEHLKIGRMASKKRMQKSGGK